MNSEVTASAHPRQERRPDQVVREVFRAFAAKERHTLMKLFADDFTFSSPRDDRIGKSAYFDRCFPNSERIAGFVIEKLLEEGADVMVRYHAHRLSDGGCFRNIEYFRVENGLVKAVEVYFGRDVDL